eukprot:TRINITY_DN6395_c1_g1_i1.p1 TRINITY_DN6395_c1_g1~~TRINITY_DN6395_c1_g1_i1.p1  ORF type:complete len:578 (-),score=81.42 TRINITY_DN6395_c1_g1_i1:191-1732(-)
MIEEMEIWDDACKPGHDNILRFYHFSKIDSTIAMELIEPIGFDLVALGTKYSYDQGRLMPVSETAEIMRKLVSALRYLHEAKQILHRDMKADQVLITGEQNVKLTDFGLAITMSKLARDPKSRCLPRSVGSNIAPEIPNVGTKNPTKYDGKVDVFGLGYILNQLYSKLIPRKGKRPSLSALRGECGDCIVARRELEDIVITSQELMNPSPEERITLSELDGKQWMKAARGSEDGVPLLSPTPEVERKFLRRFGKRLVTRYAKLDAPFPAEGLLLKNVASKDWTCLLIEGKNGTFDTFPRADTMLLRGQRIFFGCKEKATVEVSCTSTSEADALRKALDKEGHLTEDMTIGGTVLLRGYELCDPRARDFLIGTKIAFESDPKMLLSLKLKLQFTDELARSENYKALMPFSLEFDAFEFPEELVSPSAVLGSQEFKSDEKQVALNFRSKFEINLAGIVNPGVQGQAVEWMPGPRSVVVPGSFGLVVRKPTTAGVSLPTITDLELEEKGLVQASPS